MEARTFIIAGGLVGTCIHSTLQWMHGCPEQAQRGVLAPLSASPAFGPTEPRKWGCLEWLRGANSMVTQKSRRFFEILAKPPNEALLTLPDPQNQTRDHVSVPKGQKISSSGPFSSHFVRISSQIEPNPSQATWVEPGFGFWLFFQWTPLDFEGSKKAPETSFLDS